LDLGNSYYFFVPFAVIEQKCLTGNCEAVSGRCLLGGLKPNFALIIDFSDRQVNGNCCRSTLITTKVFK
jgi:hypothetical protein